MTEDFGGFNSQRQAEYFILQQVNIDVTLAVT
jgi:hypothetical protein